MMITFLQLLEKEKTENLNTSEQQTFEWHQTSVSQLDNHLVIHSSIHSQTNIIIIAIYE